MKPDSDPAAPGVSLSLGTRLVLGITLIFFLTLTIVGWFLDAAMRDALLNEHEDMQTDHLTMLCRELAKDSPELEGARKIVQEAVGALNLEKSFGRLSAPDGATLAETPGFSEFSPPLSGYPPVMSFPSQTFRLSSGQNSAGTPVYISSVRVAWKPGRPDLIYHMVTDAAPEQRMVEGFRWRIVAAIGIGTLLSFLFGGVIARQGLRPLHQIIRHIETTTADALDRRQSGGILSHKWPRELVGLLAAFDSLRGRLSHSFQRLRQFSDDAAHEIRGPINNMLGLASLTLQRERSPEEYRAVLESNLEECDRLRKLADGLLFIARADHAKTILEPTVFDAEPAIREIVDYHQDVAQEAKIALEFRAAGTVTADRTFFRQALSNLISNALRHTPAGGTVSIEFTPSGPPENTAHLVITDTGEGIAEEHLPNIFDRFYRIDAARTHNLDTATRTGLGLAIVKTIIDLHGGTITARSVVGGGASFSIQWPCRHEATP